MPDHDAVKFVTGLSAKLAARSRHVCAFLGAGAARACGLPDLTQLKDRVVGDLAGPQQDAMVTQLEGRNLEQALSRLRRIAALVSGIQTVDSLTATAAADLDAAVCRGIVRHLDLAAANLDPMYRFAAWAKKAHYDLPLEIFTINYDLLLETALEHLRVPYFDGFVGTLHAQFHTDLVESRQSAENNVSPLFVRLWKLHGSVNWAWREEKNIVRLGRPVPNGRAAAIYPSDAKYDESRRVPFVVLQDRFRHALQHPESLTIISGYSFGDAHLNELIFEAASCRQRSEFVVFCYSEIPTVVIERAISTPNIQAVTGTEAILGGVRAPWRAPEDPPPNLWEGGQCALRDFKHLAAYLARSTAREPQGEGLLAKLLAEAEAARAADVGLQDG